MGFAANAIGPGLAAAFASHGPYRTVPVNSLPPALYALAIRSGQPPFLPLFIYTFPLSPSSLFKARTGMGNFYDESGSAQFAGVQRIPDVYGYSPPIWSISGTTGVKRHSTDRYIYNGLQSALILQAVMEQYFSLVAAESASGGTGATLPRLEFYDYFSSDFWRVVPLGRQGIIQSASAPQLVSYRFQFVGYESLIQPIIAGIDTALAPLEQTVDSGISGLSSTLVTTLGAYSPWSPSPSS